MLLRSLATRLLIIGSILCAFAFNGDDNSYYFSLSSAKIYYPGSPDVTVDLSGNGLGASKIYLRAFRVSDPVDFFLAQRDPHSPTLKALDPPNTFDMLAQGYRKVSRDARYAARDVMPADARRAIRDVADLNGTRAEKKDSATKAQQKNSPSGSADLPVDDIPKGAERYEIVASWDHQLVKSKEDENWHYEEIPVPVRDRGVYLIEARIRGKRAITTLVISEYGMVVKQSASELLTYVVNTRSGERVADFPLVISRGGNRLGDGRTNADGILRSSIPAPPETSGDDDEDSWRWDYRSRLVLVLGEHDGNFIISDPYFYNYYGSDGNSRIYLHTDRPVYRPDQMAFYRGIYRGRTEEGVYLSPTGTDTMLVEIQDTRGDVIKRDTLGLSDLGTFDGQLQLGAEPPLGTYSIRVRRKGSPEYRDQWFSFSVEEYKKPEYKVAVATNRSHYTRGDVIEATVQADYYFGSPVNGAEVEYFIYRARYHRPWWQGTDWAYLYDEIDDDYSTYRMELLESGKGVLAADGSYAITYTTDAAADADYVYRIQANVVDNSRRSISGARSVEVTRGEFYITAGTDRYVYQPGDDAVVDVRMATFEDDSPVARPFIVRLLRTWWEKIPQADTTMEPAYKKRSEEIWTGNGSTDASGRGRVKLRTEQAGYFEVEIAARDARGTEITETSYLYVSDRSYARWYREGSGDVQIIPDKPVYKPGETMNALIIMPAPDIDALVTVEGSTLFSHRVERLNATSAMVHIPVETRFAPSFYLSAAAIVNEEMYSETKMVSVIPEGKLLKMAITADREIYRPGDHGTLVVRALDEGGSPVANVDVAVAMVDEAVYAIRPDATPDIQRFFYGARWNEVMTSSSLYFSFYGDATRIDRDATDALYGANRSHRRENLLASRTGDRSIAYGDVKGNLFIEPATRRNFKDVMLWTPSVRTGADGTATIPVDFPDNLTTWRITARGVTAGTAVGEATARVIARKDLMVRMELPRFMIQGDEMLIATTVHNYLSGTKVAKVQFSGNGVTATERERTITIPANGNQRIDWKVTASDHGAASLNVRALTNEESDAMQLEVPVLPRGMMLATGDLAQVTEQTGTAKLNLKLPAGADVSTGELYLTLSPSLAGSMLGALDSLIGYPYGCVEQTMSRFLPTIAVAQVMGRMNIPFDEARRAELPKMVAAGLGRLYGMQHDDGGWGWWENDKTDPFMTAYVIYGMTIAKRAGYGVLEDRYNNGVAALTRMVESAPKPGPRSDDPATLAYMLHSLAMAHQGQSVKMVVDRIRTLSERDSINDYALALLALASFDQGERNLGTSLAARLERRATSSGAYAFWQTTGRRWTWQSDQEEATAFALRAIMAARGETELADRGVRWLLSRKQGAMWHNTRRTAMVIFALTDYLKISGEAAPNFTATISVNGRILPAVHFSNDDVFKPERRIRVDSPQLRTGTNTVTIEKNGQGRLYSSARLVYHATGPALKPASAGFKVMRQYYVLRKERRGDVYVYTKKPFSGTVKTGDEIFVKVKMTPETSYEYVMLEDPLPAGCEVVTNTSGYTIPGESRYDEKAREAQGFWRWNWWYAGREVRDEKISFFATEVEPRTYEFDYIMRAQIPGRFSVMPAVGSLMYFPEVRGNSDVISLAITP